MTALKDLQVKGRRVLVRGSLNVPLDSEGAVADDFRLQASLPTIQYLIQEGARVIIIGHLGRPEGREERLSLAQVATRLGELLGQEVRFYEECVGDGAVEAANRLKDGEVLMLENLRFHKEEEENDPAFAKELAALGDVYVNNSFESSHRAHASVVGVPALLPSAIGLLFAKEVEVVHGITEHPERPLVVIIGGSKVATKAAVVSRLSEIADAVLVGNLVRDGIVAEKMQLSNPEKVVMAQDGVEGDGRELDIGPKTIELFLSHITKAETILWSGPLGQVEEEAYQKGSDAVAQAVIASGAYSVAGGGHVDAFLGAKGYRSKFAHASTGGGALMTLIAAGSLPGLDALK